MLKRVSFQMVRLHLPYVLYSQCSINPPPQNTDTPLFVKDILRRFKVVIRRYTQFLGGLRCDTVKNYTHVIPH